jgi:hypothetical protein
LTVTTTLVVANPGNSRLRKLFMQAQFTELEVFQIQ